MVTFTAEGEINLDELTEGDFISEDAIRSATGLDPHENRQAYDFACLKLRKILADRYNLYTRSIGFAIRVLTTSEATYYKAGRARTHRRGQERSYQHLLTLDENRMDPVTRMAHRKHIDETSRFLSAQNETKKAIKTEERATLKKGPHQERPIKFISTDTEEKQPKKYGTANSFGNPDGHAPADPSQRNDGQSIEQDSQGHERIDQQTQQD